MAISPTNIQIVFTNYDIITYFLNLASCSEHVISIKYRILATFNIKKKNQSERLYAFKINTTIKLVYVWLIPYHIIIYFNIWFQWVSKWLLLNANSAIFQLYHGENKLNFNEMMMIKVRFVLDQHAELDFYSVSSCSDIVYFSEMEHWRWYVMTPHIFKISWGWKQIYLVWM